MNIGRTITAFIKNCRSNSKALLSKQQEIFAGLALKIILRKFDDISL